VDLDWLDDLFAEKDEAGDLLYTRLELEDLIATYLLTVGYDSRTTSPVLLGVIEAFASRAGVEAGEERSASEQKIRSYLERTPLHPKLKVSFQQHLRESFARNDTGALENAFARFAQRDLPKHAPDRKRTEGTRPGYLALLAHRDID
jgi:hypothetical protein